MRLINISLLVIITFMVISCSDSTEPQLQVATPTIDLPSGQYNSPQTVSIECETEDAVIRYTIDGETPTESSHIYEEPVEIVETTILKAVGFREGWRKSVMVSAEYIIVIPDTVSAPVFEPSGGNYTGSVTVTILSDTEDAIIRYTTDGEIPTDTSEVYTEPLIITETTTLQAKAFKEDFITSDVTEEEYIITPYGTVVKPTFNPSGGTYNTGQNVTISTITENALIRYTTDGSEPNEQSIIYVNRVEVTETITLKAKAFKEGYTASETAVAGYELKVSSPTFTPSEGDYTAEQSITIRTATDGAVIKFTTDGNEPDEQSQVYENRFTVNKTTTVKAKAFKEGWSNSEVSQSEYRLTVINPTFTPPGGDYPETQFVTINTQTDDSQIRYTTDGSEPTTESHLYETPVEVSEEVLLKAKAFREGWFASQTVSQEYTLTHPDTVDTPTFAPPGGQYQNQKTITISCELEGAVIRYTTNGQEPNEESYRYTEPIVISEATTLKAKAFREGYISSKTAVDEYSFKVADPAFSPEGRLYNNEQVVTITSETANSIIRYTTNGEEPDEESTIYQNPIQINEITILKAKAFRDGFDESGISEAEYTLKVANPLLTPPAGEYDRPQQVAITSSTNDVVIRYTTDGSEPDVNSTLYEEAVEVEQSVTIKAIAFKEGFSESAVSEAQYILKVANPTFNPPGGQYYLVQNVVLSCTTEDSYIRYATDGSEPDENSTVYSSPIEINRPTTIKARAYKEGYAESGIISNEYTLKVSVPIFNPPGGEYNTEQNVTITSATESATIRYTTDGSEPDETSTIYDSALTVLQPKTIKARAFRENFSPSELSTSEYVLKVATPIFNPPGGVYAVEQIVTIESETEGAIIRYTTNGELPNDTSPVYVAPLNIPVDTILYAIAFMEGWQESRLATTQYVPIKMELVQGGTFSPDNGYNVTLSSYYISNTPITQSQFETVMGNNPSHFAVNPNRPVENVTWYDAIEYCNRRSIQEGLQPAYNYTPFGLNPNNWPAGWNSNNNNHVNFTVNLNAAGYRLPTEMEWEFAARGGVRAQQGNTFNTTYSGSNNVSEVAWTQQNSGRTRDVGRLMPNELGLYDMSGNVWEWCWDRSGGYPTGNYTNPTGGEGTIRIARGGGWNYWNSHCTVFYRAGGAGLPASRNNQGGFRVVRTAN